MIRSMTGYGRGEAATPEKKCVIELKAVNHRYNETAIRLPRSFSPLEDRVRRLIQSGIARGRVDVFFSIEECGDKAADVKFDKALALAYYNAMKELQESLDLESKIKLKYIIGLPGVFSVEEPEEDVEKWWPVVREAVKAALENLLMMRATEGKRLAEDILSRVEQVALLNRKIRDRSPEVVEEYREKLKDRLNDFMREGCLDASRLAAEAVLFAERSNITEETVRLESHLKQVCDCLVAEGPVGRKLDFLIQEMNREINTIASKANDLCIGGWVVEVKSELEKIREQVQNIE